MNDIELIDEIVKRAEEHQKQREKEFVIAELEKIKAEFKDREGNDFTAFHFYEVIDNHIKELKGENNE